MDRDRRRSRPARPPLGPLNLTPVPREAAATLPPLALVFDATEMHRGVASRLVSRGFPVAWHSNNPDSTRPLRGTRARTPRHAAEIAAYLSRGASRGGGGQPHHATARAGRAAVRALEALAADRPDSGLPAEGVHLPRGVSFADASDPVDDARVDDALRSRSSSSRRRRAAAMERRSASPRRERVFLRVRRP